MNSALADAWRAKKIRPIKQRLLHAPDAGIYGDCHRAALASLLDLPYGMVPHFMDGLSREEAYKFQDAERVFLQSIGLYPICLNLTSGSFEDCMRYLQHNNPGVPYLLGGTSRNGTNHTVICCDGKLIHDPSPVDSGIIGPCDDGYFWVTYIAVNLSGKIVG
jgi:hypothetical protein